MARAKAKVKVKPGKGGTGTKIAESKVTASTGKKKGKKLFQTRAQMNVHVLNKNGNKRSR